jgi:hypothetical protein
MNKKVMFALLAGCAILCCCAIAAGVGIWYFMRNQPKPEPIGPYPNDPWVTILPDDTDYPTLMPTSQLPLGVNFVETFADNSNEWELGEFEGQYVSSNEYLENGKLYFSAVAVAEDGGYTYDTYYGNPYQDLEVSIEGKLLSGSEDSDYGLIFRKVDESNYYMFTINEEYQEFILSKVIDDEMTDLMDDWEQSEAISATTANTLKVRVIGNQITLFINGEQVYSMEDDSISEAGDVGFVVYLYDLDDTALIEFDNLRVSTR